jgi:hypothetical protein
MEADLLLPQGKLFADQGKLKFGRGSSFNTEFTEACGKDPERRCGGHQIHSLDANNLLYSSYAMPLSLSNTGVALDIANHVQ